MSLWEDRVDSQVSLSVEGVRLYPHLWFAAQAYVTGWIFRDKSVGGQGCVIGESVEMWWRVRDESGWMGEGSGVSVDGQGGELEVRLGGQGGKSEVSQ